jgi:hypothetical protein
MPSAGSMIRLFPARIPKPPACSSMRLECVSAPPDPSQRPRRSGLPSGVRGRGAAGEGAAVARREETGWNSPLRVTAGQAIASLPRVRLYFAHLTPAGMAVAASAVQFRSRRNMEACPVPALGDTRSCEATRGCTGTMVLRRLRSRQDVVDSYGTVLTLVLPREVWWCETCHVEWDVWEPVETFGTSGRLLPGVQYKPLQPARRPGPERHRRSH